MQSAFSTSACEVHRRLLSLGVLVAAIVLGPSPAAAQRPLPPGITDSVIERGRRVYEGAANCVACHGPAGRGTADGPDLTDAKWLRGKGSFDDILKQVVHGTTRRESRTGKPMPMRGWAGEASDDDVRAVAAYVWSLRLSPVPPQQ